MTDRFDLEQQIMDCWHIVDDLSVLSEAVIEHPDITKDNISNILIGLEQLYNLKFNKLFRTYETLVRKNAFSERESFDKNPYYDDEIPF